MATNERIRLFSEQRLTLRQARDYFAAKPSESTLRRWCRDGFLVGRKLIRLETIREGRATVTSKEACDRFCERISNPRG